jgi:hypothetical protein
MRIIISAVVVALMLVLTVQFVAYQTASASDSPIIPDGVPANQEGVANQNKAPVSSYLSQLDDCFDVPISERVTCQNATLAPAFAMTGFDPLQPAAAPAGTLIEAVRQATARFKDVDEAEKAGYVLFHGCVSGPQEGAMGIHYVNGNLVGDGALDPMQPEALLYKMVNGKLQLTGAEYIVIAEAWDAANEAPPMLMGQMFNLISSPNRYRLPALYELHVWAWDQNPSGTFADWNPSVSCDNYTSDSIPNG